MNQRKEKSKKYWFKAKVYGWGWYPATWEGFAVLMVYFMLLVLEFLRIDKASYSSSDTMYGFMVPVLLLTVLLIVICYATGERPRWRWGK